MKRMLLPGPSLVAERYNQNIDAAGHYCDGTCEGNVPGLIHGTNLPKWLQMQILDYRRM